MKKRCLSRFLTLPIALIFLLTSSVSTTSALPGDDNLKQALPERLNLLILVKASQSSNHKLSDLSYSKTRLEIIQETIPLVLAQHHLPTSVNLGIMAYGHRIDRTDILASCSSDNVELVVPIQPASPNINLERFLTISGLGEVPAAAALEEAGRVFTQTSPEVLNVILLIADGSDTCGQDPVVKARELAESKNIVIYTIGFMADTKADKELSDIANQASGGYSFISPYIDKNEVAQAELTGAISSVFKDLLAQIPVPTQTNTPTQTAVATLTPTSTDTPKPTSTWTETPTQILPAPTLLGPIPTQQPPSLPIGPVGLIFLAAIIIFGTLGLGFRFWKSRTTSEITTEPSATESTITDVERLEQFRKDLFKAYDSIEAKKHYPKYIPLESVKGELSGKYAQEQFDELLAQARRKYPDNIWIDRDSKNLPVYIKIKR
jgi:hypothetical protein